MIKKALIAALVFLLLHAVFFRGARHPEYAAQNQWQANIIKAQTLLYHEGDPIQNVIVGSSLSFRLVNSNLPGFYNLSFGGLSIHDGLNTLTHAGTLPKYVYVEMNVPLRGEAAGFASALYSPILYNCRRVFPSLRDENQPAGILRRILNQIKFSRPSNAADNVLDPAFFETIMARQIQQFSETPADDLLATRFESIQRRVNELESKGVQVVFFEMPVNARLCNLPKPRIIRETFFRYFPRTKYKYIALPDCSEYRTADGAHLLPNEALKYTEYFKSQISSIH
jgi:hypothetical protein